MKSVTSGLSPSLLQKSAWEKIKKQYVRDFEATRGFYAVERWKIETKHFCWFSKLSN